MYGERGHHSICTALGTLGKGDITQYVQPLGNLGKGTFLNKGKIWAA
jgi:hypothetical protein